MPNPPPLTPPTLTWRDSVLLQYPYESPSETLELSNPSLDDGSRLSYTRAFNQTRNGDGYIFTEDNYPILNKKLLTFTNLKKSQIDDLNLFIKSKLGLPVKYTDWYSQVYKIIILSPDAAWAEDVDGNEECERRHTISLEIDAELTSWPS